MKRCSRFWGRTEKALATVREGRHDSHVVEVKVAHRCFLEPDHHSDHECVCGDTLTAERNTP